MDITGSYTFNASPQRVWDVLMDPAVIASCIPGCEKLEPEGEDRYRARLKVALAAITGSYDGTVTLSDKTPPNSYRLTVEGQGKPGFVKGNATITLRPDGANTIVCSPFPKNESETSRAELSADFRIPSCRFTTGGL